MRFILVDRIIDFVPWQRATGLKAISATDDFFREHFPGNPVMPGVLILEAMAQTAGGLLALSTDLQQFGLMSSIQDARFRGFAKPGDVLRLEVEIASHDATSALVTGVARAGDREIARARYVFTLVPLERVVAAPFLDGWRQLVRSWLDDGLAPQRSPAAAATPAGDGDAPLAEARP